MSGAELRSNPQRLQSLDSLRGIAAFTVLLGHTTAVCDWDTGFFELPLINNFFDGRSAVSMFFVLSGFVLTFGNLKSGKPLLLVPFYVRRITRIWLPWFAVFCLSIAAKYWLLDNPTTLHPPLSAHHLQFWSMPNSGLDLAKQSAFLLHDAKRQILPQDWSLGVELKGSFMIPLFLFLMRRSRVAVLLTGLGLLLTKAAGGYLYVSFVVGVLVAHSCTRVHDFRFGGWVALLGYVLYQARWTCDLHHLFPFAVDERAVWITCSIGCGLVIFGVLKSPRLSGVMAFTPLVFLGRVSYSCFLLQVIVLLCLAPWLIAGFNHLGVMSPTILQPLLLVTVSAICLTFSWLSERWIEIPCIRFGKILSSRIERVPLLRRWSV